MLFLQFPTVELAKIFDSVYFASWGKSCEYFAFRQARLVEVFTWQVWYAQEDIV